MNIYILGNFTDKQTADYIIKAFLKKNHIVYGTDIRLMYNTIGPEKTQAKVIEEINNLEIVPDIILILKGTELTLETIKYIKTKFSKAKLCNWFFDKYLGNKEIWKNESYFPVLKEYDYYFCSLKGVRDKLHSIGFHNCYYLDEACSLQHHGKTYTNNFQKQKYGSDVAFVGTIGLTDFHKLRIELLNKISTEGFNFKIWGDVACNWGKAPLLKEHHTGFSVINLNHSMVAENSKINIGIDQDATLSLGHSARLYRVMCCGGLYLSTPIRDIERYFNYNAKGEKITGNEDLVFFYDEEDMCDKIDFLLEHEDIRKKIAENGMKKVREHHTFEHRIDEMLEIIKGDIK